METKETPQQKQDNIPWEIFPKRTVPALKGVLDELGVSTLDRSPEKAEFLCKNVMNQLRILGGRFDPSDLISNAEIGDTFESLASEARKK